jgi:hypothetical protein
MIISYKINPEEVDDVINLNIKPTQPINCKISELL